MHSNDPKKRKKPHGQITLDGENPISSPAAVGRLNANGTAMGSRQHYAAVKQENDQQKNRLDNEVVRESLETRKAGLVC